MSNILWCGARLEQYSRGGNFAVSHSVLTAANAMLIPWIALIRKLFNKHGLSSSSCRT